MTALIPNAKLQFVDANGFPLVGGSVFYYAPATETPKDTYQDPLGATVNTNPVILDARGQASIWGIGSYRQIVQDRNGVTIWDQVTQDTDSALAGNYYEETFASGTGFTPGTTTVLTLARSYGSVTNIDVHFDGVYQGPDQIASLVGPTLTFVSPIPVDVQNVYVKGGLALPVSTPGVGVVVDASVAAGTKLYNRINNEINVCDPPFNADPTGVADSSAAFQAAINFVMNTGKAGVITVPRGTYTIKTQLSMDRSSNAGLSAVSFRGDGSDSTTINYTGTGNTSLFAITGHATTGGPTEYAKFSGMTLLGTGSVGTAPFLTILCSFFRYSDLHIEGFDFAFYGQDIDHTLFDMCSWRFNLQGFFARENPVPVANSTGPNQLTFLQCQFGSNHAYGVDLVDGAGNVFIGCQFEHNGIAGAGGFGVQLQSSSYQGGPAALFDGCYFESNNGIADVILIQTDVTNPVILDGTFVFNACCFNRADPASFATNSILTNFAAPSVVGQQIVVLTGCTFKDFNSYVPSGARPYISYSGVATRTKNNFLSLGCIYQNALEAPAAVQNPNKCYIELGNTADQPAPSAIQTPWNINTVGNAFSWATAISGNAIPIPEPGCYAIGATLTFNSVVGGIVRLTLFVNGNPLAYSEGSGTQVASVSCLKTFAAGDLITIAVNQSSGSTVTISNSGGAESFLTLTKLIDG